MGVFNDEAEVYTYLGGIFEIATKQEGLSDKLADSGVVLRIHYTDPDATITVDMPAKTVVTGPGSDAEPNVELFMTADTGNKFWLGKVNLSVAMARGTVRAKGPVPKLLKLIPTAKELFPEYEKMLKEAGRDDLVAV
ncbi:SCP2 sterol-binding domain-containing protein [Pseudonocardia sp. WMMC193]|uniref:SCP2 sterol-binding domain-containing protein n=1 Tax=Pseudonocardia sp. WMMC193 TaxID=2911965 RepID=UPI001F28BE24|nr:SCP2 sterol-binding domain-containing protein [Pseudonocardia sp. WMMC193]MCF7550737.1 SCP2 sterol-binding domain-containing protein [Pseudonocardia sp. WMMC193]